MTHLRFTFLPPWADVPVMREPFTGEELLVAVRPLLARRLRVPDGRYQTGAGA